MANRDVFSDGRVAHTSLKGRVTAEHFTEGVLRTVATPVANMRTDLKNTGLARQVAYGHPVRVLEETDGLMRDETTGYVGYIDAMSLSDHVEPNVRVHTRSTFLFNEPHFKSADPTPLSCGSLLHITDTQGKYAQTADGKFAIASHLTPIGDTQADFARTASKLVGTPYLWGGNSAFGIDCSGLIQLSLQAAGLPCPGDSDQQQDLLGATLPSGTSPQRNDIMFWKGHVALVVDDTTLIHANAHHMAVEYEAVDDAIRRIREQGDGPVTAHKRL